MVSANTVADPLPRGVGVELAVVPGRAGVALGAREVRRTGQVELLPHVGELVVEVLVAQHPVEGHLAADAVEPTVVGQLLDPVLVDVGLEVGELGEVLVLPEVERDDGVPGVPLDREGEVVGPCLLPHQLARRLGTHVVVGLARQRRRLEVLWSAATGGAPQRLVLGADLGDDVVGSAHLGQRDLHTRASSLAGLEEDEAVAVGRDHGHDPIRHHTDTVGTWRTPGQSTARPRKAIHFRGDDWYGEELGAARFTDCTFTDVDFSEAIHRRGDVPGLHLPRRALQRLDPHRDGVRRRATSGVRRSSTPRSTAASSSGPSSASA